MIRKLAFIFSLLLIFTIPWETAITVSTLGTLTRLIGIAAAGLWAVSILMKGSFRTLNVYHLFMFLFVLFNLASLFWTVSERLTISRIITYLQLAILSWVLWDLFDTSASLWMAMQAFVFGAYVTIASQISNFISGQTIAAYSEGRFTGAGQNAGELALILSLSLPLAWHLATAPDSYFKGRFLRVINFAFIPLALLASILTASRTSLLTNAPGFLYIAGTMSNVKPVYRVSIFLAVVVGMIMVQPYIPQATISRLSTIGESIAENDLGGRVRLWEGSLAIFQKHPLLGIGSNALSAPGQLGAYAHNTFLSILAELGIVGFLLFIAILFSVVFQAIQQPRPYPFLWGTVLIIWLLGVFSLTWEYSKPTWFFLNLVVISANADKQIRQPARYSSLSVNPQAGS